MSNSAYRARYDKAGGGDTWMHSSPRQRDTLSRVGVLLSSNGNASPREAFQAQKTCSKPLRRRWLFLRAIWSAFSNSATNSKAASVGGLFVR